MLATLKTANDDSAPFTEKRDFEALKSANTFLLVGTCVDIFIRKMNEETSLTPQLRPKMIELGLSCPAAELPMEQDAQILEELYIVETRATERCGSRKPCKVCKTIANTEEYNAEECIEASTAEGRQNIKKKGAACRFLLSSAH